MRAEQTLARTPAGQGRPGADRAAPSPRADQLRLACPSDRGARPWIYSAFPCSIPRARLYLYASLSAAALRRVGSDGAASGHSEIYRAAETPLAARLPAGLHPPLGPSVAHGDPATCDGDGHGTRPRPRACPGRAGHGDTRHVPRRTRWRRTKSADRLGGMPRAGRRRAAPPPPAHVRRPVVAAHPRASFIRPRSHPRAAGRSCKYSSSDSRHSALVLILTLGASAGSRVHRHTPGVSGNGRCMATIAQ